MAMKKPIIVINVRKSEQVKTRMNRVSGELDKTKSGEHVEIISDDELMLKVAPKMVESTGKAKFIKVWQGEDGYYHTLVERR